MYEIIEKQKRNNRNYYFVDILIKNYISFNGLKYAPLIKFGGSTTECFQISWSLRCDVNRKGAKALSLNYNI